MAQYQIGVIAQKGGVYKSTIARLITREYAKSGWNVKLADMDIRQGTSTSWGLRRLENGILPELSVEPFSRVEKAVSATEHLDLLVFDGQAKSDEQSQAIAKQCDMIILPTSPTIDDMEPTVTLAHDLKQAGIRPDKINFARTICGDSENEEEFAISYLTKACHSGYFLLDGSIPFQVSIRQALNMGNTASEIHFKSVKLKVNELSQSIANRFQYLIN